MHPEYCAGAYLSVKHRNVRVFALDVDRIFGQGDGSGMKVLQIRHCSQSEICLAALHLELCMRACVHTLQTYTARRVCSPGK